MNFMIFSASEYYPHKINLLEYQRFLLPLEIKQTMYMRYMLHIQFGYPLYWRISCFNILFYVSQVIQNLHISNLELRDENSLDIMPYINKRKVDIILVPLSNELATFKDRYIIIMDRHVRSLIQYNVLRGQTANISKGRVI